MLTINKDITIRSKNTGQAVLDGEGVPTRTCKHMYNMPSPRARAHIHR